MKESCAEFDAIFSKEIIEAINPERTYPKWIKREIKRKYGKHPTIYIDVWVPYLPSLYSLLPKISWVK